MKILWHLLVFHLLTLVSQAHAQNRELVSSPLGKWYSPKELATAKFNWQAQWIWLPEKEESDVMLARKTVHLDELPQRAEFRITASSQYQLFINGEYIQRGPARSAPHHQSFDILNLRPLLRKGKNVIALRVHYKRGKVSYHHEGRAGLLAQLDLTLNDQSISVYTNDEWKVSPDPAWSNQAPKISRFNLVVADRVDLRNRIEGWNQINFQDENWANARPLMRTVGWPFPQKNAKPQALTPPWTKLIPRDLPYLMEKKVRAVHLIESYSFPEENNTTFDLPPIEPMKLSGFIAPAISKNWESYLNQEQPLVIPKSEQATTTVLLFDFGKILNGSPILDIESTEGTVVDIMCAPFMVDQQFTHHVVDSDFLDRLILPQGRVEWEATYWKPTRYLGLVIRGTTQAVNVHSVAIRSIQYPFQPKGYLKSNSAAWIDRYMKASAKTIDVSTTDAYTDNYRERRQYAQTGFYAALGNYWLFGDHALQRRYLFQTAQEQRANGIMPAYGPLALDDFMIILDSNCLWLRSLKNYFLYSGDTLSTQQLLPYARRLLDLLHGYINQHGLIDNPPYAYWMDHAQNDRRGANFCLNGHYLGALEDFAQVLHWLNDADSTVFQSRATLLRQSLQTFFWAPKEQLFVDALIDGKPSDRFSEHANAMALALQVATAEQGKWISEKILLKDQYNFIKRSNGMTIVTPAMSYFLHKGLCAYGYVDESMELFRNRFNHMLQPEHNGTLWEEWWLNGTGRSGKFSGGRTRSDAQTESAFPPALFGEYLLGVKFTEPGMQVVEIQRPTTNLKNIEGLIPSPKGELKVEWNFQNDQGGNLTLKVPEEMRIKLDTHNLGNGQQAILVNGKSAKVLKNQIVIEKGDYVVNFE